MNRDPVHGMNILHDFSCKGRRGDQCVQPETCEGFVTLTLLKIRDANSPFAWVSREQAIDTQVIPL